MTLRNLAVWGLCAVVGGWTSSCASGGGEDNCGNGYCEVDETSRTCPAFLGPGTRLISFGRSCLPFPTRG